MINSIDNLRRGIIRLSFIIRSAINMSVEHLGWWNASQVNIYKWIRVLLGAHLFVQAKNLINSY